jgi:hypothetical protein
MGAKMPETGKLRDFEEDNEESRMSWRVLRSWRREGELEGGDEVLQVSVDAVQ